MHDNRVEVTAIGTLAVDYFALVPSIPAVEEKIMSEGYAVHPGGVAGNVITQLARLGVRAGWFGKIGDDEAGKIVLEDLAKEGIDSSHVEIVKGENTMFTWIQVNKEGGRSITMFPNVLIKLTAEDVESTHREYIASSRVLHAEACLLPLRPVVKAMEIAKENGVKIVFNLDVTPTYFVKDAQRATEREMKRAFELADVLIPCKNAAKELIGSDDFVKDGRNLLDYGSRVVAVTLGDRGCIVLDRENTYVAPAYRVKVVDTTGAGDAFQGGFIYSVLKGFSLEKAGTFANACGALCCTKVGARSSGTLRDVEELIRNNGMKE
jgi:sugar/nucleoside kinase (ribokinase family)